MPVTWLGYALLSAVSASLVPLFARWGSQTMDTLTATFLRAVIMALAVGVAAGAGRLGSLGQAVGSTAPKDLGLLALSAVAGAASWLFYFQALKLAPVARVAPVDRLSVALSVALAALCLGERPSPGTWAGVGLIVLGTVLVARS